MTIKLFEDLAKECNARGWFVLNCYQFDNDLWRCNLQRKAANGATENVFTRFADGRTPSEALRAALAGIETMPPPVQKASLDKPAKARHSDTLTAGQEARLIQAIDQLIDACDQALGD